MCKRIKKTYVDDFTKEALGVISADYKLAIEGIKSQAKELLEFDREFDVEDELLMDIKVVFIFVRVGSGILSAQILTVEIYIGPLSFTKKDGSLIKNEEEKQMKIKYKLYNLPGANAAIGLNVGLQLNKVVDTDIIIK